MVMKDSVKFLQKVIYTKKPRMIVKLIRTPTWLEKGDIRPTYFPKKTKFKKNMINKSIKLYNSIEEDIRLLKPKQFKSQLKKWKLYPIPVNPQEPVQKATKIKMKN